MSNSSMIDLDKVEHLTPMEAKIAKIALGLAEKREDAIVSLDDIIDEYERTVPKLGRHFRKTINRMMTFSIQKIANSCHRNDGWQIVRKSRIGRGRKAEFRIAQSPNPIIYDTVD